MRHLLVMVLLAIASGVSAQTGERGSVPPGQSRDGAAPSDGALKGGTILPGESAGMPDRARMERRCDELTGTLREDCLKQEREAASDTRRSLPAPADSGAGSSSPRR
jgi:hypothetical protein